jgi:hypothetical protein
MKPLAANSLLQNRYLIIHHIGKGGMGEVYLAVDQRLGNPVALKRTVFRDDAMMWDAFEREARILARLRHSVLPKVSDHFSEKEEQYLVMEYISGDDLSKRLEAAKKPFPLQWVLYWADELLDALNYLHTHEPPIIHRDIKPQNLKLTNENHVVLLDFGLAKNSVAKKTQVSSSGGSLVGYTPNYAPIEQIRGAGTNPRSDIYSLSATLYQLITGTIPMDALSRAESVIGGNGDSIPSPRELVPDISPEISAVILRGLSLNSEQRYSDAREMQKALREAYALYQQRVEDGSVAFHGEETLVPEAKPEAPLTSMSASGAAPVAFGNEVGNGFSAKAQEPPETLTAAALANEPDMSATIPAEQWMQGETQGFTHDEIRRTTIDEDAFKSHGFDPDAPAPLIGADHADSSFASLGSGSEPPIAATAFTGGAAGPIGFTEGSAGETVREETAETEISTERSAPIRPVTKPLDPAAKKASSGWGIKLVGIAAVLCLLIAGGGAAAWYAVKAKLIHIPGLEQSSKPPISRESLPVAADEQNAEHQTADTSTQTLSGTEKETPSDLGAESPAADDEAADPRANAAEKKNKPAANPGPKGDKSKSAKIKKPGDRSGIEQ